MRTNFKTSLALSALAISLFTTSLQAEAVYNKTDENVANCLEDHIITGQYFLINTFGGQLNLLQSSLKTTVACQREVSAWVNECNALNHNMGGCIQMSLRVTQALILDAWNHKNNLVAWRNR